MKDENKPSEIIGVVAENKHMGLDVKVGPVAFWPHPQLVMPEMTVIVRSQSHDAPQLMPAVRELSRVSIRSNRLQMLQQWKI
jgi:hypothetical protein